jgi:hypothetical protein
MKVENRLETSLKLVESRLENSLKILKDLKNKRKYATDIYKIKMLDKKIADVENDIKIIKGYLKSKTTSSPTSSQVNLKKPLLFNETPIYLTKPDNTNIKISKVNTKETRNFENSKDKVSKPDLITNSSPRIFGIPSSPISLINKYYENFNTSNKSNDQKKSEDKNLDEQIKWANYRKADEAFRKLSPKEQEYFRNLPRPERLRRYFNNNLEIDDIIKNTAGKNVISIESRKETPNIKGIESISLNLPNISFNTKEEDIRDMIADFAKDDFEEDVEKIKSNYVPGKFSEWTPKNKYILDKILKLPEKFKKKINKYPGGSKSVAPPTFSYETLTPKEKENYRKSDELFRKLSSKEQEYFKSLPREERIKRYITGNLGIPVSLSPPSPPQFSSQRSSNTPVFLSSGLELKSNTSAIPRLYENKNKSNMLNKPVNASKDTNERNMIQNIPLVNLNPPVVLKPNNSSNVSYKPYQRGSNLEFLDYGPEIGFNIFDVIPPAYEDVPPSRRKQYPPGGVKLTKNFYVEDLKKPFYGNGFYYEYTPEEIEQINKIIENDLVRNFQNHYNLASTINSSNYPLVSYRRRNIVNPEEQPAIWELQNLIFPNFQDYKGSSAPISDKQVETYEKALYDYFIKYNLGVLPALYALGAETGGLKQGSHQAVNKDSGAMGLGQFYGENRLLPLGETDINRRYSISPITHYNSPVEKQIKNVAERLNHMKALMGDKYEKLKYNPFAHKAMGFEGRFADFSKNINDEKQLDAISKRIVKFYGGLQNEHFRNLLRILHQNPNAIQQYEDYLTRKYGQPKSITSQNVNSFKPKS